jgi:transposase InsO family protein/transposase-like protein
VSERSAPPARMRYSFESRCRAVQALIDGWPVMVVANACGAARATVYRWWRSYQSGGWEALRDRPCVPRTHPRRLSAEAEAEILAVRERSGAGPLVIAALVGCAASTVGKVLRRRGQSRLPRGPRPLVRRYERERPGELLHIDSKKLGRFWRVGKRVLGPGATRSRGAGWQYLHVAVDDHSRLAYAEVLPHEDGLACAAFLRRALRWYAEQGLVVERVLTDNAGAYRSRAWRGVREAHGVGQRFTRPYTPRTNGKAERFIQMLLRQWAYAWTYPSSAHRTRALAGWLRWYNRRRPHGSLGGLPPISRVSHLRGQYS